MITAAPPGPGAHLHRAVEEQRLNEALRAWRARVWTQQILHWTSNGAITGILLACLLLLTSRFVPWADVLTWALSAAAAAVLCSLGAALWFRPSLDRTARLVDSRLALHDRLSTAWELRNDQAPLPALQRRDALAQLGRHTPGTALPLLRPRPARLAITAAAALALILLLVLPNPMTVVLQQQAALHKHLTGEIASLQHLRTVIANEPNLPPQERSLIDQILQQLQNELAQAQNQTQAQQDLAQAQAQLNHLRDSNAAGKAQALATTSALLQNSSNANLSAAGKALASGDLQSLAKALQQLASQLKNMTPAQRQQLAQQLQQAANQTAASDPQLSSALRQLASSIAANNPQELASALKAFQNAAAQDIASQASTSSINQASQTLQSLANLLTSATDTSSQNPAQGQSPGQSQNPGQTQTPGQSQANSGSGSQGIPGSKSGKNEQVFIPGQTGSGQTSISSSGDNNTTEPGKSVPYSQVIAQYAQMAHDYIDNSAIPPDLKDLVDGYYNALEGQH
jgi:hypothetical protein